MFSSEKGFSTPIALIVIFSLCLMTLSVIILVYTNEKKLNSYKRKIVAEKKAENLLLDISEKIQLIKDEKNDFPGAASIEYLLAKYRQNNLILTDVSTGINKEFLKDEILESRALSQYLSTEDAQLSEYGWINPKYADNTKIEQIENDFGDNSFFPVINEFPAYNLFAMNIDFLTAILSFHKISEAEDKAEKIKNLTPENLSDEKLCEILGVQRNHSVFDFLGTKTVFWNVSFETEDCMANAVFAAIPQKNDKKEIEKYVLVERHISYKGGEL